MGIMINRMIGLAVLISYVYILLNKEQFAPGLQILDQNKHLYYEASDGYGYIIMLPLLGFACFIMPGAFSDLLSPKY